MLGDPGNAPQLLPVPVAQPRLRAARVVERLARRQQVQVAGVDVQTAAELRGIADVPVAGNQPAHTRHGGEQPQAGPVIPERITGVGVQERDLDVGQHVARHQHPGIREEHRSVPRRVPVMDDHLRRRAIPGDVAGARGHRSQAAEQRKVVTGRLLLDPGDHLLAPGPGGGHGARRRVPGRVCQVAAPQDVIPVRMGRETGPRP